MGAGPRRRLVLAAAMVVVGSACASGAPGGSDRAGGASTATITLPSPVASSSSSPGTSPGTVPSVDVAGSRPDGDLAFLGPVRQVPVNGITVGFRQFGTGPPLVLIVGQDSAMSYWGPDLLRALAEHFQVTMFDNRGVGASTDQPDRPLTIELMSDDTAGLIEALGLERPAVFGWSTGGEIALALAVRHPDRVGPLMVSGATAGSPQSVPAAPELDALLASSDPADQVKLLDTLFTPSGAAARQRYIEGLLAMPAETVSPRSRDARPSPRRASWPTPRSTTAWDRWRCRCWSPTGPRTGSCRWPTPGSSPNASPGPPSSWSPTPRTPGCSRTSTASWPPSWRSAAGNPCPDSAQALVTGMGASSTGACSTGSAGRGPVDASSPPR